MGNAHGLSCCKMNPTSSPCLMMALKMTTTPNASLKVGLGYKLTDAEGLDSPCFTTMTRFHVHSCQMPISATSANLSQNSWSGSRRNSTHPSFSDPQNPPLDWGSRGPLASIAFVNSIHIDYLFPSAQNDVCFLLSLLLVITHHVFHAYYRFHLTRPWIHHVHGFHSSPISRSSHSSFCAAPLSHDGVR